MNLEQISTALEPVVRRTLGAPGSVSALVALTESLAKRTYTYQAQAGREIVARSRGSSLPISTRTTLRGFRKRGKHGIRDNC